MKQENPGSRCVFQAERFHQNSSSRTTRRQAAEVIDRERREERPLDPNNTDDVGRGESNAGGIRIPASISPPQSANFDVFPNLDVLGTLLLHLEPNDLYLCQRVCSHWRDQFSDLFSIRKGLDQHHVEICPLFTSTIRQRREMVLARNTLKEACAMDVPEVEISSDLQKLYNLNVTKKVLDLIGLEMYVRLCARLFPANKELASTILAE